MLTALIQVVLWHNVCNSVHLVMRELMQGLEAGLVTRDTFTRLCGQLSSKLCCLPVCVLSWLISYSHFGQAPLHRPGSISPLEILDMFLDMSLDTSEVQESEGLPHYAQRSTMMVNIVRKMRQELEEAGARRPGAGLGLSLDTKEAGLEAELALVWEEMWGRGRLDIAGTKSMARLYTLGGAEWFVTVLVERLLGLVYSTDLDRATAAVFSLLHIDLVPCSLALLLHTLPRCLVGEGREQLLVHPGAKCLARLTVDCLAASLSSRGSTAYTGRGSTADLAAMCDGSQQPVKLRKLCGGGAEVTVVPGQPAPSQDQLVDQAHTGLFQLLAGLGMEPVSVSVS